MSINRKNSPLVKDITALGFELPPIQLYHLDNGIPVYFYDTPAMKDFVSIEILLEAGNWFENKNGIADSASALFFNGTENKSSFEINTIIEQKGGFLSCKAFYQKASIVLQTFSKHLPTYLATIREALTSNIYAEEEINIYKTNSIEHLEIALQQTDYIAEKQLLAALFGKQNPYGKYPTKASIEQIERKDILDFYETYYKNGEAVIFMTAQYSAELFALLNQYIGSLPLNSQPINITEPRAMPGEKHQTTDLKKNNIQASLRIGTTIPADGQLNFYALTVLNHIFGGDMHSRLMKKLREENGLTYNVAASLKRKGEQYLWSLGTDVNKENYPFAIAEIYAVMLSLGNQGLSAAEVHLAKTAILSATLKKLNNPFYVINTWKEQVLFKLPADNFDYRIGSIKNISKEELQQLAQQYLQPNWFYESVVF